MTGPNPAATDAIPLPRAAEDGWLRQVFDSSPVGLAVIDLDGVCQEANPALHHTLGHRILIGRRLGDLVHPDDRALDDAALTRLVGAAEPAHHLDVRFRPADGRYIWGSVRRSLVLDEAERPAYVVMQVVDVTARYTVIATLQDFAARASHDLKSPLMAIGGFAATLRDHGGDLDDEVRREMVDRIADATARAASAVAGLLAEACSAGDVDRAICVDPLPALECAIAAAGVDRASVAVSGSWRPVAVGGTDLASIFTNIVENAHHYGRDASGALQLRVSAVVRGGVLVVEFHDSGPGLPDPEGVFEPFVRGLTATRVNPVSTGLGLTLVRRAVERCGGSVSGVPVESGGALIRLVLPLAV